MVIINKRLLSGLIAFIFLIGIKSISHAATVTWTGNGTDSLASTSANWDTILQNGDDVIFDNSSKGCSWDLNFILSSLIINSGYNGIITLDTDNSVFGDINISGGTLILSYGNLTIGAEPPSPNVTTNPATNINGDASMISATVNPNGIDTMVYFECGTGITYNISTTPQSIGSGSSDLTVTDNIINLLPNTSYHCRAVVINSYGTFYGNDVNFSTPPITLKIISPVNGATINRPDNMIRGTVANTTGNETGVTVNGLIAVVYNNEFVVNHLPFAEGSNIITAIATDTAGDTTTTSITVNAVTTSPHVILKANIESGLAPLTTYFTVSIEMPNSAASYQIDYAGTTFKNISYIYATEGIYYPTITVTDDQNNTYSDTIAIVALNQTQVDTLLRAKWEEMKISLGIGDITTALNYIASDNRASYQTMFNYLIDQLPSIVATQTEINLIKIKNNIAEYELVTLENGIIYSYTIIFNKDTNGIWMIQDF